MGYLYSLNRYVNYSPIAGRENYTRFFGAYDAVSCMFRDVVVQGMQTKCQYECKEVTKTERHKLVARKKYPSDVRLRKLDGLSWLTC